MADADHAPAFWRSVATAVKADHGVLFDLFNEPYITSWSCWEHGCRTGHQHNGSDVTYETAGMQQLVDAVRSTGSTAPSSSVASPGRATRATGAASSRPTRTTSSS